MGAILYTIYTHLGNIVSQCIIIQEVKRVFLNSVPMSRQKDYLARTYSYWLNSLSLILLFCSTERTSHLTLFIHNYLYLVIKKITLLLKTQQLLILKLNGNFV